MSIVGYLLGAGASAQCIPVVNGMQSDLQNINSEIEKYFLKPDGFGGYTGQTSKVLLRITAIMEKLADVCERHYSIDTYAKKLFLTDRPMFERLKLDLCLYFTLKQILVNPDKRYDNFFSSILTSDNKLPSNIKILSWNYDFQLEKSFCEFNPGLSLNDARSTLGICSPNAWKEMQPLKNKFKVFKLNGSARIESPYVDGFLYSSQYVGRAQEVNEVINNYLEIIDDKAEYNCELKFAWEKDHYESLFENSKKDLEYISVLVIVGYSFPFFNREVDIRLFNNMPNLKTIYIQDPNHAIIKETMEEFFEFNGYKRGHVDCIGKTNKEQFVFPKELDVTSYYGD
jgi:hypothetical protein